MTSSTLRGLVSSKSGTHLDVRSANLNEFVFHVAELAAERKQIS